MSIFNSFFITISSIWYQYKWYPDTSNYHFLQFESVSQILFKINPKLGAKFEFVLNVQD